MSTYPFSCVCLLVGEKICYCLKNIIKQPELHEIGTNLSGVISVMETSAFFNEQIDYGESIDHNVYGLNTQGAYSIFIVLLVSST